MNAALISIIAPCFNGEHYIGRFLDSILAQTHPNIELILINDGSKDKTEEIIMSYKPQLEQKGIILKYEYRENAGIGAAIDRGLKLISGEYFTWLGTDDFCHPDFLQKLVGFMNAHPQYSVVRNDGYIVQESDPSIIIGKMADHNHDKHNEKPFINAILERNFNFGYSLVRTKDFFKVCPNKTIYPSRQGQNWQILLPLFYYGKAAFFEEPLYYVVSNQNSVSRNPAKNGMEAFIAQREEHKNILVHTILSMNLPKKENDYYLKLINIKYIRVKLQIAYQYHNKTLFKSQYALLKKHNAISLRDLIRYVQFHLPWIDKLIKIISRRRN